MRIRKNTNAFTLVELLTVLAVVAIISTLGVMAAGNAMETSKRTEALVQIRNLGQATVLFTAENNMRLPGSQHSGNSWVAGLAPYLGLDVASATREDLMRVYRSPGDPNKTRLYSYAINDFLLPNPSGARHLDYSHIGRLAEPSKTLLFTETAGNYTGSDHFHFARFGYQPNRFQGSVDPRRYSGGNVYLFADGHVEWIKWETIQQKLTTSGDRFIHPEGNP